MPNSSLPDGTSGNDLLIQDNVLIELSSQNPVYRDKLQMALRGMASVGDSLLFKGFLTGLSEFAQSPNITIRNNGEILCALDKKGRCVVDAAALNKLDFGKDSKDYTPKDMLSGLMGEKEWAGISPYEAGKMLADLVLSPHVFVGTYSRDVKDFMVECPQTEKVWWKTLSRHIQGVLGGIGYDVSDVDEEGVKAAFDDWDDEGYLSWVENAALIYQGLADFDSPEDFIQSLYFPIPNKIVREHNLLALLNPDLMVEILTKAYEDKENPLRFGLGTRTE